MHEVGLATDVLAAVLRRADGRTVLGAGVLVGAAHRVSVEALQQGFEVVSVGTPAEGAQLEVEAADGDELVLTWVRYPEA